MIQLLEPPRQCLADQSADLSYEHQTLADIARRESQHEADALGYPSLPAKIAQAPCGTPDEVLHRFMPMLHHLYAGLQEDNGPLVEPTYVAGVNQPGLRLTRLGKLVVNACHDIAWRENAWPDLDRAFINHRLEPGDVQDLLGTALEPLGKRTEKNPIQVNVPANFPLVPMDFTLMAQVIVNLLENAIKYSPQDSLIEVTASLDDANARLQIHRYVHP